MISPSLEDELAKATLTEDSYLSIGVFDGVHLGHQYLLDLLKQEAQRAGCLPGVVTFSNNPRSVLNPETQVRSLTTLEERIDLLYEIGVATVIPITFTPIVSKVTAMEFVSLLQRYLHMRGLVIGPDFALGYKREGIPETLRSLGEENGFSVIVADAYAKEDTQVSSTVIRNAIEKGDMIAAYQCLGRHYSLSGEVVHGMGRGSTVLGYPTANVAVDPNLVLPPDGIYTTWIYVDENRYSAATSIGVCPTFGLGSRTVEAFILDFHGDVYKKKVRLEFVARLRGEIAFGSVNALRKQIAADVENTRRILDSNV